MLFVLIAQDRPGQIDLRLEVRPRHLAYIAAAAPRVKLAGPLLTDDGQNMRGSLLVIEAQTRAEAEAFAQQDPYTLAGLFEKIEIHPWRWVVGAPET